MRRLLPVLLVYTSAFLIPLSTYSQDSSSTFIDKVLSFPDKVFAKIDRKANTFESKLSAHTEKSLARMQRQEEKLKRKLLKRGDSTVAMEIFGDSKNTYEDFLLKSKQKHNAIANLSNYSPHADSLANAFFFLQQNNQVNSNAQLSSSVTNSLKNIKGLQTKFNQTEQVRKYLQQRQRYLKEKMQQLGMMKQYKKLQKQIYYYQAQIKEYRQVFENPQIAEKKILGFLSKVPAFQDFFAQNSQLASVFQLPGSSGSFANTANVNTAFPTRMVVQQNLMNRLGASANPQQAIQQGIQNGTSYLNSVQSRARQMLPGNQSDLDMPDFKVNTQKTKSFWKRLEIGTNLQTVKSNFYFPTTSDIGLSAGYKISDKSILGIGTSTKIGWGSGWNNIAITAQGLSLRSFLDMKLKGNFWITGGAEMNYRSQFRSIEVLKNYSAWQQSALIGLSKKYSIGKKWKGNAQILYDFLWRQQVPYTQAFLIRFGYSF